MSSHRCIQLKLGRLETCKCIDLGYFDNKGLITSRNVTFNGIISTNGFVMERFWIPTRHYMGKASNQLCA